jgi:glycine/D-amino acid oxidase-like deaminating enzyme
VRDKTTIVVGAGVIGLTTAVELVARGAPVTLIDRGEPGQACSFGNAGIVAVSEVFPIISLDRIRSLPAMLIDADSPAVVRPSAMPRLTPWLVRAAGSLGRKRQVAIVHALAALNREAIGAWRETLATAGAQALMRERGMLRLVCDARGLGQAAALRDALVHVSVPSRLVSREELRELEPDLGDRSAGALLHETDAHVADPYSISAALLAYLRARGVHVLRDKVLSVEPAEDGARVRTASGVFDAAAAVITAGLQSQSLMRGLGCVAPLQAERGYHLTLAGGGDRLQRPVTFHAESCVATPMGADLRLAGTVEFADDEAAPNWRRAQRLGAIAARYFEKPLPLEGATRWVGSRPSLPDSLPAIGVLGGHRCIGYAFGHQHLGLTQAAISARLLVSLMRGERAPVDHKPYDISRFSRQAGR